MLRDGLEHVARLRDLREVDLGTELFPAGAALLRRRTFACVFRNAEMLLNFLCFVHLERTGVGLLFRDAKLQQHV
jgi:hypothetical protein